MANKISLNPTSYHGAGAIKSIVDEAKGRSFNKILTHISSTKRSY